MAEKKINRRTILSNKITRKVIAPLKKDRNLSEKASLKELPVQKTEHSLDAKVSLSKTSYPSDNREEETGRVKKVCSFCQSKTNPSYTDMIVLRRFATDRAKIVARSRNGLCSKHQRFATRQIKYARHLALLPFTPKV